VVAADLATTLSGPEPFTVFAPTNAAFSALLTELGVTKEQLLADKPLLTSVLTQHVVPAKVLKAGIPLGKAITTVQGGIFKIDAVGAAVVIRDGHNRTANITTTDLMASNGVIHVVDKVLLPAYKTTVAAVATNPDFSIMMKAVTGAGLIDTLNGTGPFTVFAPTKDAFAKLLTELEIGKEALLADTALLTQVLTYHVVDSRVVKADVPVGPAIAPVQGGTLTASAGLVFTNQRARTSNMTATDILASNGVIHVIDTGILPAPSGWSGCRPLRRTV